MFDKVVIQVNGMSCSHCEKRVEHAALSVEGVKSCKADAKTGKVTVRPGKDARLLALVEAAIEEAGYKVAGKEPA